MVVKVIVEAQHNGSSKLQLAIHTNAVKKLLIRYFEPELTFQTCEGLK